MTRVKFFCDAEGIIGFEFSGHSTKSGDDTEGKTVCAAVSSAVYMAANTVTEIIGDSAQVQIDEAMMFFKVKSPTKQSRAVLEGLRLHITELSKQYSKRIEIITEV